jgi:hypothetical protein
MPASRLMIASMCSRSAIGGAVLVASKVLRALALLAAYRSSTRGLLACRAWMLTNVCLTGSSSCRAWRAYSACFVRRALATGLSSVMFAAATLALTSVVLLLLQRPWTGKELGGRPRCVSLWPCAVRRERARVLLAGA